MSRMDSRPVSEYGTCLRGHDGPGAWIAAYAAMTGG